MKWTNLRGRLMWADGSEEPSPSQSDDQLPCYFCGSTATEWAVMTRMDGAIQIVDGAPVCRRHAERGARAAG